MKVLLIYPPHLATPSTVGNLSVGQPLGLAYLGAVLEQEGHEVHLLDALIGGLHESLGPGQASRPGPPAAAPLSAVRVSRGLFGVHHLNGRFPPGSFAVGLSPGEIAARVRDLRPQVVGISVNFSSLHHISLYLAELVKAGDPGIITILGGSHVTLAPAGVLENPAVDYIVAGEGERALPALLRSLSQGKKPENVPGVGSKDAGGRLALTPPKRLKNLDAVPFPGFHLLPMERYFAAGGEGRVVKMYTSRGCTFNCCFCSVPLTSQRRFLAHSPERVAAEIRRLITDYAIEGIMFEDDNMTLDMARAKEILRLIIELGQPLKLYARNIRADRIDPEMAGLMKRAGFDTVWITPESGNPRVLETIIGKKCRIEDITASVVTLKDAGLNIAAAFVIGLPGETRAEIDDTRQYAKKLKRLGVKEFWFSIAQPLVGTRLYKTAVEKGYIKEKDYYDISYTQRSFDTEEFTAAELNLLRDDIMSELSAVI
jgi:magnesium-protoporphyrin IX monomethyl ester (oxidative) cyclase